MKLVSLHFPNLILSKTWRYVLKLAAVQCAIWQHPMTGCTVNFSLVLLGAIKLAIVITQSLPTACMVLIFCTVHVLC